MVRRHSHLQDYQRGQVCKLLQKNIYTSLIQRHSHLQNYQTLLRIQTRPVTFFYCLPVSFIFRLFFAPFPLVVITFSCTLTVKFPTFSIGFCTISSDRYHVFLQFLHPLRGFSVCFVQRFFFSCFLPFSPLSSMGFCTISSRFLIFMHFPCMFPRVLPASFIFRLFLHHFLWLLSHFPALSLYLSSIFTASSRFVPSIRSDFLHFLRDFSRFPLIVIMFSYRFIVFSKNILIVSPATKKADLGGIETPPSANYLVVHHPAKCCVFWR